MTVGDVDVLSQSGSLLLMVLQALAEEEVGVDWAVSLGNAASIDLARGIEMALDRPGDGAICGYVETLGRSADDIVRLAGALDRAAEAGRQAALVKVGASPTGARVAQAHTASITGDREVVGAFLARHGAVLADDIEDLARFVNVHRHLARARRGAGVGVAVIEGSGGSAAMTADLAGAARRPAGGVLRAHGQRTCPGGRARIVPRQPGRPHRDAAGPGGGGAGARQHLRRPGGGRGAGAVQRSVPARRGGDRDIHRVILLAGTARLAHRSGTPVVVSAVVNQGWSEWIRTYAQDHAEVMVVRGVSPTIRALATSSASRLGPPMLVPMRPPVRPAVRPPVRPLVSRRWGPRSISPSPAPPSRLSETFLARGRDPARQRRSGCGRDSLRLPVVVKAIVPGLVHKEQWGGVRLGIASAAALAEAVGRCST